jgi:hypothetical protein
MTLEKRTPGGPEPSGVSCASPQNWQRPDHCSSLIAAESGSARLSRGEITLTGSGH